MSAAEYQYDPEKLYNAYRKAFKAQNPCGTLPRWKYVRPRVKRVWIKMAQDLNAS